MSDEIIEEEQILATQNPVDTSYLVDDDDIDNKTGNFIFTIGNPGCGKTVLQHGLIHRLWTDEDIILSYSNANEDPAHDFHLDDWVKRFAKGEIPPRTLKGLLQEFNIKFGQKNRPMLPLNFLEISGEDIKSILPDSNSNHIPMLSPQLFQYLSQERINKRFIFVSDTSLNRKKRTSDSDIYQEDILFKHLIEFLLKTIELKKIKILFVAAKWDIVNKEYVSPEHYFRVNFPNTRASVKCFNEQITASYMRFSIGDIKSNEKTQEQRITSHDNKYVSLLIQWVYNTFTNNTLKGYPKIRRSFWDMIKQLFS